MKYKYLYGPVHSRRLGLSLGISLIPHKVCNFDCLYCQLGKTPKKFTTRDAYNPAEGIVEELKTWLLDPAHEPQKLSFITLAGTGEPTLHLHIAEIIAAIKKISMLPVAVITNASLLDNPQVRESLLAAALIVPSLDAVDEELFIKINRPAEGIKLTRIIEGLIKLRKEFKGQIWLEIMLVKGINDTDKHIYALKEIVQRINPDRIQLNSPVRTTAEEGVLSVEKERLKAIKEILGPKCEIV